MFQALRQNRAISGDVDFEIFEDTKFEILVFHSGAVEDLAVKMSQFAYFLLLSTEEQELKFMKINISLFLTFAEFLHSNMFIKFF